MARKAKDNPGQIKISLNKEKYESIFEYLNSFYKLQSGSCTEHVERCVLFALLYARQLEKKGFTDGKPHDFLMGHLTFDEAVLKFNTVFNKFKQDKIALKELLALN